MKIRNIILGLIIPIFCFGTCRYEDDINQNLVIQNNSDYHIVPRFAFFSFPNDRYICLKPDNDIHRRELKDATISPDSSKKQKGQASSLINNPQDTLYVYIFHRIDIDTMSCEEFNEKRPVQEVWKITKADADALNWTLVYDPTE